MGLSLCITCILATMDTLFMSPLVGDRSVWGKRLTGIHITVHTIHSIMKILLYFGEHSHGTQISSFFCPFREVSICLFPKFLCYQLSNRAPSKPLTIHPNHPPESLDWYLITHLAISPFMQSEQAGALLEVLPTGRMSLHHCPPGMSPSGAAVPHVSPVNNEGLGHLIR